MIQSKKDYKFYLEAGRIALGKKNKKPRIIGDEILRKIVYYKNCMKSVIFKPYYYFMWLKFHIISILFGFSISPNVFGPGLSIGHRGTIVVNSNLKIEPNCRIHVCVSIGTKAR